MKNKVRFFTSVFLLLASFAVLAATINQPVTKIVWDNPAANTTVTSITATCGTQTASTSAPEAIAGPSGTMLLSAVIKTDGTYTCTVQAVDAKGSSPPSNATVPITRAGVNFTIAVKVPDAPLNLRVE